MLLWEETLQRLLKCQHENTIICSYNIVTPLAYDEFAAIGDLYQNMIDASAAMRTGTSEEIADAAAFLLGEHSTFITGTDLLIDGGVMAAIRTGQYKLGN